MKQVRGLTLALLTAAACFAPALAEPLEGQDEESRVLSDNWYGTFGWFGADITTDISFGFGDFVGTTIRLEDDLSLQENKDSFRFGGRYRFNRRHAIAFGGFQLNRKASTVIDQEIEIDDPESEDGLRYNVGANVESTIDNDILAIFYSYSFFNNGKIDAGISAGFSTYHFELILEGQAEVIDENGMQVEATDFRRADSEVTAPVPAYGMFMNYAIRHNVIFSFNAALLNADVGDFEARVSDTRGSVEWFFTKHISVGAGVTNTSVEVRDTGTDPYRVEYRYGGFLAYMGVAF